MKIKGKVHCMFEQSGTFKREFIKLGIPAEDYDIQNNFGETDHICDLFSHITTSFEGGGSIFDNITEDDLVMAFFPCIYFCNIAELNQRIGPIGLRNKDLHALRLWQLEHSRKRQQFYEIALKFTDVVERKGIRMIVENPWNETNYTHLWWFNKPSLIDKNRTSRGDYFVKPTAYWFINCEPTHGSTFARTLKSKRKYMTNGTMSIERKKIIAQSKNVAKASKKMGVCSEERSMMSPDYARNFICDFVLGKPREEVISQQDLFDM